MPTDEQAAGRKAALEREKAGYQTRLAAAEQDDDAEKVERYKALIKGVDKALKAEPDDSLSMSNTKDELLAAAELAGVEADESMTKAEILEALEGDE